MKTSTLILILGGGAVALWLFTRNSTPGKVPAGKVTPNVDKGDTNVWDWLSALTTAGVGRLGGGSGGNGTPTVGQQKDGSWDISGAWGGSSDVSDWTTVEGDL